MPSASVVVAESAVAAADVAFALFVIFCVLPLPRHFPLGVDWTVPTQRDWSSC